MVIAPAMVVGGIYMSFINPDSERVKQNERLASTKAAAPRPEAVLAEQARLMRLNEDLNKVRSEEKKLTARWNDLVKLCRPTSESRAVALQRLSHLLWQGGLYTVDEAQVRDTQRQLPDSFDEMLKHLAKDQATTAPRLWKVHFYGRYADVMQTLDLLEKTGLPIIPLSITMNDAVLETNWRSWTLVLWL
jgi:hypothetical protein